MKLHPDGIAEGTPEECAAFKHIDAALAARNKPQLKAIEAPRKPAGKPPRRRDVTQRILALAVAKDGITTTEVAEYLNVDRKTAYNRLYALRGKGLLWQTGEGGVFKVHRKTAETMEGA